MQLRVRKICVLPATLEVCYATPRGVATPSLGSPDLSYETDNDEFLDHMC